MDYTTLDIVKRRLGESGTGNDIDITATINAACRAIDSWTQRSFGLTALESREFEVLEATKPAYRWHHGRPYVLDIPDIVVSDDMTVQYRESVSHSVVPWPTHESHYDFLPITPRPRWPRTQIRFGHHFEQDDRIVLTATWGWPEVPAEVKYAAALYSTRLFRRFDSPLGITGNPDFGKVYVSKLDPDIEALLKVFKKRLRIA